MLLLKLMLSKANFLLLDEPTNHLDIGSCEALEDALSGYDGTLFVVSHDRYLINKLADKIYVLGKDGARLYLGNYDAAAGPAGRSPRAQGKPLQAAQGAGKRPAQKAHRPAAAGGGHRGERGPGGAAGGAAFPAGSGRGL